MRAVVIPGASSCRLHVNRCFRHLIFSVMFLWIEMHLHSFSCRAPSSWCRAIKGVFGSFFFFLISSQGPNANKLKNDQESPEILKRDINSTKDNVSVPGRGRITLHKSNTTDEAPPYLCQTPPRGK